MEVGTRFPLFSHAAEALAWPQPLEVGGDLLDPEHPLVFITETVSSTARRTTMVSIALSRIRSSLVESLIVLTVPEAWGAAVSRKSQGLGQDTRLTMASRYSLLFSLRLVS